MSKNKRVPDPSGYDIRLLQVFRAVVEAGSFTAAELKLNKSKSAISMDIAALEGRLGVTLCRRGRGGFSLTAHGKEIHLAAIELFSGLAKFRDQVGRIVSRVGGEFTVALDDNFLFGVKEELSEALRAFTVANPEVFLTIRTSSAEHVTQLVLDGSADVGINVIPRVISEVMLHPLFSETMILYCGARHPLFTVPDAKLKPDIISQYDCIDVVTRQTDQIRKIVERMRVRARAPTIHSRVLLILSGNYLGFLPPEFASSWVVRGELRPLRIDGLLCNSTCFAIARRDAPANAARERFIEELKRAFAARRVLSLQPDIEATLRPAKLDAVRPLPRTARPRAKGARRPRAGSA